MAPPTPPTEPSNPPVKGEVFKYGILILAIFVFIGCDQLTKEFAKRELSYTDGPIHFLGMVSFEYAENTGSFLSIGAGLPPDLRRAIHIVSAAVILIGFVLLLSYAYRLDRVRRIGYCLLLAGACGNLVDRFSNDGRVIDFIVLKIGSLETGVFNLADVFILAGLALVLIRFRSQENPGPT